MPVALSDFDYTLTKGSTYKALAEHNFKGIKKQMDIGEIEKYISKLKGTPVSDITNLNKFIKYRERLLKDLKNYDEVHIISRNPFVRDFVPDYLKNTSYPTIEVEIENGILTGKIKSIVSKKDIIESKNIINGHAEIFVFTDGCSGDGEIIDYLENNNYELGYISPIESIYKYEFLRI